MISIIGMYLYGNMQHLGNLLTNAVYRHCIEIVSLSFSFCCFRTNFMSKRNYH